MSFELFFNISKDGNFFDIAGESGTTLKLVKPECDNVLQPEPQNLENRHN